ncbi:MAG: acyl-CoA dehydrogenase [Burkholderiales bacterium PBB1]|nr:MAG: acyl-CoA dehydrogenase [Burkholderiales bacterium PBB1]
MSYLAPVKDMLFCMKELAGLEALSRLPGFEDSGLDTAEAVLREAGRFCAEVVEPLNAESDRYPPVWRDGEVSTSAGFKDAFRQFTAGGWQGLQHPLEFGGQGLPKTIGAACAEMLNSASLSFALCPLLTDGAIEALLTAGSAEQQRFFLPKMIDGTWTGTMNLTEPQAGSDLAMVRTRAVPQGDGSYRLSGQKIYITYGEHDMAENIVHLVLARTPDAPPGVKGISLFLCPKFLVNADGSRGARNDVYCASIEHKLGIKASPTAVLVFGDDKGEVGAGAIAQLIGEENRGLEYMFVMMNAARFSVGVQGIGVAERAYQRAVGYARDRVQSKPVDVSLPAGAAIIHHPDVKRMLMTMRAHIEGCRALACVSAAAFDKAHHHPDAAVRQASQVFHEFTVPLVKGYSTEMSIEVTSLCVQVHGGMGYIEETGAAQHFRDARILTIYEGTTAIQANDLLGRKTLRDGGELARSIAGQIEGAEAALAASTSVAARSMRRWLQASRKAFLDVVDFVLTHARSKPSAVYAGSVPYLMLAGQLLAGWQLARALLAAEEQLADESEQAQGDAAFLKAKIATAHFYAEHILSTLPGLRDAIIDGADSVGALAVESF